MLTSRQVLAGRALLDWTQQLLVEKAGATLTMLKRLESDRLAMRDATRDAVRKALGTRRRRVPIVPAERAPCWSGGRQKNRREKFERLRKTVEGKRH